MEIATLSHLPAGTSLQCSCLDSYPTEKVCVIWSLQHRLMPARHITWALGNMLPEAHLPMPIQNAITAFLKSSLTRWWPRPDSAGLMTSSSLEVTYMPLTQQQLNSVWRRSSGLCSGRIRGREASRFIRCMTLKHLFRPSSISPKPVFTT